MMSVLRKGGHDRGSLRHSTGLLSRGKIGCQWAGTLVFHGVFWLVLAIGIIAIMPVTGFVLLVIPWLLVAYGFFHTLGTIGLVISWPIDILIDDDGIRIGGLRRSTRRARKGAREYPELPTKQRRQVFFCPWEAVQRVEVVTDRAELKKLRRAAEDVGFRHSMTVALGRLWSPQMRAALVINLDPDRAVFPRFLERGEEVKRPTGTSTTKRDSFRSPVWIAPTRHPDQLRAALERHGVPVS
jgi:hypothetical protein